LSLPYRKKLIEVALPLEAINKAASREKDIHVGHPANLHTWWSRKPLAACRAVLFAQLVDDPSSHPEKFLTEDAQSAERDRLFEVMKRLVQWEHSNNPQTLRDARKEILDSCDGNPPLLVDPFCGGGSIALEAQRLGLQVCASDLNPVAALITKALIEIPQRFQGKPPVHPGALNLTGSSWTGTRGLVEDVRFYGNQINDKARQRIGHLFPEMHITHELAEGRPDLAHLVGRKFPVVAWIWARAMACPSPACKRVTPLVSKFWLSTHDKNPAWAEPKLNGDSRVKFIVHAGQGHPPQGTIGNKGAHCIFCGTPITFQQIRDCAHASGMTEQLMGVALQGQSKRIYVSPCEEHERLAEGLEPSWRPETDLPNKALGFRVQRYGIIRHCDFFTNRQLILLDTLSNLLAETRDEVIREAHEDAYADAVVTYLALALDRVAQTNNRLVRWLTRKSGTSKGTPTFDRQIVSMVWEFSEGNPFGQSVGSWSGALENVLGGLAIVPTGVHSGHVSRLDAADELPSRPHSTVSTDPPYYDNIGYADLSDFFYVWLRHSLLALYPDLFKTVLVPKRQELIAASHMFEGDKDAADSHFLRGLTEAFRKIKHNTDVSYPITIFYAFKQAEEDESDGDGAASVSVSTGWEKMLEALLGASLSVVGTWPMRTERGARGRALGANALASSVVLICRHRADDSSIAGRREFIDALRSELPKAMKRLQHESIAPVDLAQAAIGPGMAIFTRYSKVKETDGSDLRVRTALGLINQALDEVLAEQEGEYDAETRWAVAWFEQCGAGEGKFGDAETLSRAKDTAVNALEQAGIIKAKGGKVQLIPREALNADWDPASESRLTVWELTQHLIRALETGGEIAAARIIRRVGSLAETAKDLAYRLFVICDRKGWSHEALAYNILVKSWPELQKLAASTSGVTGELSSQP
jgi:putative DNA methylase